MFTSFTARLIGLSEIEAVVLIRDAEAIPEHFYLVFGQFEILIASSLVKTEGSIFTVRFASEEESSFIDSVCSINNPADGLSRLAGKFGQAIERRILTRSRVE